VSGNLPLTRRASENGGADADICTVDKNFEGVRFQRVLRLQFSDKCLERDRGEKYYTHATRKAYTHATRKALTQTSLINSHG
jgi:hypothetical protein